MTRLRPLFALFLVLGCTRADPAPAPHRQAHRVVSLTPSSTEVVAAVGGTGLLVGVDQYSTYPPEVEKLPKVGDFVTPNVEAILATGCDIAIGDATQAKVLSRLEAAGIKTISSPMQTLADVRRAIADVGRAIDDDAAANRALATLDDELARAEARARGAAARAARRPRVLVVIDRRAPGFAQLVAAGPDTYLDELLARAGGENVLADSPARYTRLSPEDVISRSPDVILDATHVDDPDARRADWDTFASVPAVRDRRVHVLGDAIFERPGPRLGRALSRMVDLLWPETVTR